MLKILNRFKIVFGEHCKWLAVPFSKKPEQCAHTKSAKNIVLFRTDYLE